MKNLPDNGNEKHFENSATKLLIDKIAIYFFRLEIIEFKMQSLEDTYILSL